MFNYRLYGSPAEYKQLSKKKQMELVKLWRRNRSKKVMRQLVLSNFKFLMYMAEKYMNKGLPITDLITLSYMGFRKAIDHFKYKYNTSLVNYAAYYIKNLIRTSLISESSLIKMPVNMYNPLSIVTGMLNDNRSDAEIMAKLGIDKKRLADLKYYHLMFDTSTYRLGNRINSDEELEFDIGYDDAKHVLNEQMDNNKYVYGLLNTVLSSRERDIIVKRFGFDGNTVMSLTDIAIGQNCTGERVRQIKDRALYKLRKQLKGMNI